jgi:hypothetical protein
MHDLDIIHKINAQGFADAIHNFRKQGRYVIAKYEGLHLVSLETFTTPGEAVAAMKVAVDKEHGGERNVLFTPVSSVPGRDQSEDRSQFYTLEQLAELGLSSAKTI